MPQDPKLRASRLRTVLTMPEYVDTIGAWLKDAQEIALMEMSQADGVSFARAQGAYKVLKDLQERISAVLAAGAAAIKKEQKHLHGE